MQMEKEVRPEMKLHLPGDPLDSAPLDKAQNTSEKRDPKNEECKKEYPLRRYRKGGSLKSWIAIASPCAFQLIKNHLKDLWTDEEYTICQNNKTETEYDGVAIPNDILLETQ